LQYRTGSNVKVVYGCLLLHAADSTKISTRNRYIRNDLRINGLAEELADWRISELTD
jgi:hypothetical protein